MFVSILNFHLKNWIKPRFTNSVLLVFNHTDAILGVEWQESWKGHAIEQKNHQGRINVLRSDLCLKPPHDMSEHYLSTRLKWTMTENHYWVVGGGWRLKGGGVCGSLWSCSTFKMSLYINLTLCFCCRVWFTPLVWTAISDISCSIIQIVHVKIAMKPWVLFLSQLNHPLLC